LYWFNLVIVAVVDVDVDVDDAKKFFLQNFSFLNFRKVLKLM
jgi:hypothetical protein